ncbi:MAG: type II secretion system F family protein [Chloroflexi bacterium]|nr:type II secretion system F family protein [Chloroflexota bacterium]
MAFILAGTFAFGVVLVFFAVAQMISRPSRVDTIVERYTPRSYDEVVLAQPFSTRVLRPVIQTMARLLANRTPQQMLESLRHKLDLAGNPLDLPPVEFMGLRAVAAIFAAVVFGVIFDVLRSPSILLVLMILVGAFLGFYLPILWLDLKVRTRQEEIELSMPDALDMLTICVEAGLGLDAAMQRVAERWNSELGRAFGRALYEIRIGKTRQDALRDMANRADVPDLTNFIAAILQVDKLGGGIAKMLRIQSEQMRVMRRQRAYARVNQTPAKLVFPLVFCFFPSLFIVLLGPAVVRLLTRGLM